MLADLARDRDIILKEAMGDVPNVWEAVEKVREGTASSVEGEKRTNANLGLPVLLDMSDLIDFEGRDYRRWGGDGAAWNQPSIKQHYESGVRVE